MLTHDTNHVAEALANLVEQFKNKVNLSALITALVTPLQELEDTFNDLFTLRALSTATGVQLDGIGSIVGEDRAGADDTNYRIRIAVRILLNLSNGTPEEVMAIAALLFPANTISIVETPPAAFTIYLGGPGVDPGVIDLVGVAARLAAARPAGVGGQLVYSETDDAHTFTFSSDDTEQSSSVQGWAPDDQSSGGELADTIIA